jgi:hypothetical protein
MIVLHRNSIIFLVLSIAIVFCSLSGVYSSLYATDSYKDSYTTGKIIVHIKDEDEIYIANNEDGSSYWVDSSVENVAELFIDFDNGEERNVCPCITNDGDSSVIAFMVVGLPTATESELSENIPSSQYKAIKLEAYALICDNENFYPDDPDLTWESLDIDVDGDFEESTDTSDRLIVFNANDDLMNNYNDNWRLLNKEEDTETGIDHVYQSEDGYDYYIFVYEQPLAIGETSDYLFDYINNPNSVMINDTSDA